MFFLHTVLPLPGDFSTLPVVVCFCFFFPPRMSKWLQLNKTAHGEQIHLHFDEKWSFSFHLIICTSFGGAVVTGHISQDILLTSETHFCLLLTSQAVTCFLCLALFSVNSKLVTVQEQLFLGDSDICLHQNFIPISKPDLLPRLRCLWNLQAWCHSHPAHAHSSPWGEIHISQKALELSLLQSSHWRLCHILRFIPSDTQRLCYLPLKGTSFP